MYKNQEDYKRISVEMNEIKHILPTSPEQLLDYLTKLGISYRNTPHPPAFTVEEGNRYWGNIPGVHCKNLFCKDAKGKLWLIMAPAGKTVNLKTLPARIGSKRLSFGNPALLFEVLGVEPGSVTPFALINDKERKVNVVLDKWMMDQEFVNFHPLRNTATTTLTPEGLLTFIRSCGHIPQMTDITEN